MKKIIILVILLGIACLCFTFLLPYKNRPVKIKELNYDSLFNDKNRAHLNSAARFGIKRTLKNRTEANDVREGLVHVRDNSHYSIAELAHSIPYLIDGAAELLDMIDNNFLDSLESKGLNPNRIIVTSVLRTQEDIKKLQRSGNSNAVSNSAHCYATTFDITYARFDKVKYRNFRRYESVEKAILKNILGEVLRDLRKQNKCHVKYEVKQRCFHITTRM